MPRKGPAYPIAKGWREQVLGRISEMEISQNALARLAKISKASLSEALDVGAVQTTVMPQIHKALGWDPPVLLFTPDTLELHKLYSQMSDFDRGAMIERARGDVRKIKETKAKR